MVDTVLARAGGIARADVVDGQRASAGWHADITFEKVPSDYAVSSSPAFGRSACT